MVSTLKYSIKSYILIETAIKMVTRSPHSSKNLYPGPEDTLLEPHVATFLKPFDIFSKNSPYNRDELFGIITREDLNF